VIPVTDVNQDDQYQPPSAIEFESRFQRFNTFCSKFIDRSKCPDSWNCHISSHALNQILLRVDRREHYYHYFHRDENGAGVNINQRKIGGLFAYWILKFKPISVDFDHDGVNEDWKIPVSQQDKAATINESFAAYTLYTYISRWYELEGQPPLNLPKRTSPGFHDTVLYAFRYRNISIDAMMLFAETIVRDTFNRPKVQIV